MVVGDIKARMPGWFTQRFRAQYTALNLFDSTLPKDFGIQPLPETPGGILVSECERAVIELLSEVGIHQGIEEAPNILEGARSLRPDILATLLKLSLRAKKARLCVLWATKLMLPWAEAALKATGEQFGHSRWTARLKDGTILILTV